jgi:hypothetical protein
VPTQNVDAAVARRPGSRYRPSRDAFLAWVDGFPSASAAEISAVAAERGDAPRARGVRARADRHPRGLRDDVVRRHRLPHQTNHLPRRPASSSWKRLDTQGDKSLLSYRDDAHHATIVLNGRCDEPSDDAPLPSLTQHLFLLFTERTIEEETTIPFDGREARRTVLSAKLDGVPKHFVVLVAKKDNCVYDFVLIVDENASAASQATANADFQRFVGGFHAEPR